MCVCEREKQGGPAGRIKLLSLVSLIAVATTQPGLSTHQRVLQTRPRALSLTITAPVLHG